MVKGGGDSPVGVVACGGGGGDGPIGGGGQRRWAAAKGVQQPLGLTEAKKRLDSDYHVSGDGLPHNWMIVLSRNWYII
jgi:hypothetical protein